MVLLESSMVPLGSNAHDFNLKGIDGEMHSLSDYDEAKALVIIFMCNHCPYVQRIWDDLVELETAQPDSVQFVGINSNAGNPNFPEDTYEKMKVYAKEKGHTFPYLADESQSVGQLYDAQCTPDIFVYDADRKLYYRGAFDGLSGAIESLLANEKPPAEQRVSMGCSIKWL